MKNSADQGGCSVSVDNTYPPRSAEFSYPMKAEFNNCFIIYAKY